VAPPNRQGLISGIGTGLGYLGVALSLPLAHWIDQNFGRPWVFSAAAVLFLAAAIPLFLFVPERRVSFSERLSWTHIKAECYKLGRAVRELPRSRNTFYFLLANLCVLDALNAFILWLSVYITKELLVPQAQFIRIMLALNISAFLFGILMGKATDVIGSRRTFLISIIALFIAVFVAGTTRNLFLFKVTLLTLGAMAASGIWTAGRKLLIELAPPEEIGKFFGLYGFTTKISAFGSSAFSILADLFNYRAAVLSQLITVILGLIFFLQLRSKNRTL
jgi:UMF1 family MFS transporter